MEIEEFLDKSFTAYHATQNAIELLTLGGFKPFNGKIARGGKYFADLESGFIAVSVGTENKFEAVVAHTDSPALKIKGSKLLRGEINRLNCEVYGGAINRSIMDRPLKVAGRAYYFENGAVVGKNIASDFNVICPSLCIHFDRNVNSGTSLSVQNDLAPIVGKADDLYKALGIENCTDADLFAVCAQKAFSSGISGEYICSPRLDNLVSVYCATQAIIAAKPKGINIVACFNSEEIGSLTQRGAWARTFTAATEGICKALKIDLNSALEQSLILSVDNAHALHPSHTEKADPVNRPELGGGVTIKYHSNYATTAKSACRARLAFGDLPVQEFYSNSDLPCGSTIGNILAASTGADVCDIGVAQLAMHSAVETAARCDISTMTKALTRHFEC